MIILVIWFKSSEVLFVLWYMSKYDTNLKALYNWNTLFNLILKNMNEGWWFLFLFSNDTKQNRKIYQLFKIKNNHLPFLKNHLKLLCPSKFDFFKKIRTTVKDFNFVFISLKIQPNLLPIEQNPEKIHCILLKKNLQNFNTFIV